MGMMQTLVEQFHRKYGHRVASMNAETARFRAKLILEEAQEVADELEQLAVLLESGSPKAIDQQLAKVGGEGADLLYVANGLYVNLGFDGQAFFNEVHRANMEKEPNPHGGKPLKPDSWTPPRLVEVTRQEMERVKRQKERDEQLERSES